MKHLSVIALLLISDIYGMDDCPKLKPPEGLEITQVLGTWYAVRGIEHGITNSSTSIKQTKSCPTISIISKGADVIEFQWNSNGKPQRKINLTVNKENPGLLEYKGKKASAKGSFKSLQLSMIGASRNPIAITMCKTEGRLASVIIDRNPQFMEVNVQPLTDLLGTQRLDLKSVYDRCVKN